LKQTLSASKIKTMSGCSWQYWCKYHLKLPDKTNDGALKGSVVHLVLECLGKKRHKKYYKKILKTGNIDSCKSVRRLILKHAKRDNLLKDPLNLEDIDNMVFRGLVYDFLGERYGKPTQTISEKDFEIEVEEGGVSYKVRGFIDKLFIYKKKSIALIRDFKTNKKVYEGKEVSDNLQDYIYTLAVRKLYPEFKNIKMEFVFLKAMQSLKSSTGIWEIIGEEKSVLEMRSKSDHELKGFEYELSEYQSYADSFSEETSLSNLAFHQGMPKDGSFSGRLLCGFAKFPDEKKKDGSPKWYCTYKFPFKYYSLLNKDGDLKRNYFTKEEAFKKKKDEDSIVQKQYDGCPTMQKKPSPFNSFDSFDSNDDFDLDKF